MTQQDFRDIELSYAKIGNFRSFDFVSTPCLEIFLPTWKCFHSLTGNFLIKIEKVKRDYFTHYVNFAAIPFLTDPRICQEANMKVI